MESIWNSTVEIPPRNALEEDISVEAVVIGAGMAGILTAYLLKENGVGTVVLEADRIGSGQTGNTTAKITSQHGLCYEKMIGQIGKKKAPLYGRAHEEAILEYERIISKEHIACHFQKLPAYLYSACQWHQLEKEAQAAQAIGLPAKFLAKADCPVPHIGVVRFENQAQFHPLEFIKAVSSDLEIYEKTKVISVRRNRVHTDRGNVTAENIIFASHYPFVNVPGFFFIRQHQERSCVAAFENAGTLNGMYYGIDEGSLSLRSFENMILAGGGSYRTGQNETGGKYDGIRQQMKRYFPGARELAFWSAQDCMPHDHLPMIGNYSLFRPAWYVETGFRKWGMTSSMLSAMIVRDEICGIDNPYERLFSPQRIHPFVAAGGFAGDLAVSVRELTKGIFPPKSKEGKVLRCPHMGCRLYWNEDEHSWDCPCHGSRFGEDGKLVDCPAQTGLQK